MFPQENEYKSLLPKNAHGSPNFDKEACTNASGAFIRINVPCHEIMVCFVLL